MYCRKCEKELTAGENFCSNCGTVARMAERIVPPPVPPITNPSGLHISNKARVIIVIFSFLIGFEMIGGGVYGIVALGQYTNFIFLGSS